MKKNTLKKFTIPSEESIVRHWKSFYPKVTVICITYNHQDYIEDAINGFLIQKTDFPFEILIHDDASTDATVDKIKAYHSKYPRLIRPIYQKINLYSQGERILFKLAPLAKGKYIALCEGDDFWIDEQKLQLQINSLDRESGVDLCFHAVRTLNVQNGVSTKYAWHCDYPCLFSAARLIKEGGSFCPTVSIVTRRRIFDNMPHWAFDAPVGDYFLQALASLRGGALFLPQPMAIYRVADAESWSFRVKDATNRENYLSGMLSSLKYLDQETQGLYEETIRMPRSKIYFHAARLALLSGNDSRFRALMHESWKAFPCASKGQMVFYRLRNLPSVLRLILRIYMQGARIR